MNWLNLQMSALDTATTGISFAANWMLQSSVLISVGLAMGWLLRKQGAAVQSVVFRTTMLAALVCPLATIGLSLTGASGWSVSMPSAWSRQAEAPNAAQNSPQMHKYSGTPHTESNRVAAVPRELPHLSDGKQAPQPMSSSQHSLAREEAPAVVASTTGPNANESLERSSQGISIHRSGILSLSMMAIWLCISFVLTTRLVTAWGRLGRLRRRAVPADADTLRICRELAYKMDVSTPQVLRAACLPSPCLAGMHRPAVLLPDVEQRLSVREVLIHELAHLKRRDCHWNLLRQWATAIFFFQPLLWKLSLLIESTAEEVCDDFVVEFGCDRHVYAHQLLDIVELSSAPLAPAGVGIVSLRSMLAKRVTRIMDTSRTLSTRAGNLLLFVVVAGGLVVTTISGLVGLAPTASHAQTEASAGSQESEGEAESDKSQDLLAVRGSDSAETVATKRQRHFSGRITTHSGEPATDTHVAVVAMRIEPRRGGDLSPMGDVLAETRTDESGHYRLTLEDVSSKTHRFASLIARKSGLAVAWERIDIDESNDDLPLQLQPEQLIKGQLVDLEGQPAAGVQIHFQSVIQRSEGGMPSRNGVGFRGERAPDAWLQPITSNEEGRFTIHGVPEGHGVFLNVAGSDLVAPQGIALNTGMPEQRGERDATYRPLVMNVPSGEEAVLPLPPAQVFEGIVTYEDTGQPASHARLTIWASQQEYGSMVSVEGKADAEGRYRISPKPGIRFGIITYPPSDTPYLARQMSPGRGIRWEEGDRVRKVDVSLPRGVMVRGKVVDGDSNAPIPGATIQYMPEEANNPNTADEILTGWQGIQLSNEQGEFAIAILPGPGWLLVQAPKGNYVFQEIASRKLRAGKSGGQRYYAHAIHRVNPDGETDSVEATISLSPGATVTGTVVDQQDRPIEEALVITRLNISPNSTTWRGHTNPSMGGRFELSGLDPQKECPVYILDAKQRLGATVDLRANDNSTTVKLSPCGEAKARFINPEGQPHVGFHPGLHMVVTPGSHEHDFEAARRGELLADADFVSNIDRTNYRPGPQTDKQGSVTFPALIPGATYRLSTYEDGKPKILKQFSVESGERLTLGDITVDLTE